MSDGTGYRVMRAHMVEFTSPEDADNFRAAAGWIEANPDTVVLAAHCETDDEATSARLTLTVQSADGVHLDALALKHMGAGFEAKS